MNHADRIARDLHAYCPWMLDKAKGYVRTFSGGAWDQVWTTRNGRYIRTAWMVRARASVYAALWDSGMNHEQIAELVGLDRSTISHSIATWAGAGKNKGRAFTGRNVASALLTTEASRRAENLTGGMKEAA